VSRTGSATARLLLVLLFTAAARPAAPVDGLGGSFADLTAVTGDAALVAASAPAVADPPVEDRRSQRRGERASCVQRAAVGGTLPARLLTRRYIGHAAGVCCHRLTPPLTLSRPPPAAS
jgi:hypothetical protein